MPAAVAAAAVVSGRARSRAPRAGRVPGLCPLRAGPVLSPPRPEPLRAAGARSDPGPRLGLGPGIGPSPRLRRLDFPSRSFPSRPRRRPSPGFQTRRAAKIARGRISTSQWIYQAGQLGSNPRPTAEGPGSWRARSPGLSPAPLSYTLPPLRFPSRPPLVGGVFKSKLQLRGWDFSGSSLSQPCSLGMGSQHLQQWLWS